MLKAGNRAEETPGRSGASWNAGWSSDVGRLKEWCRSCCYDLSERADERLEASLCRTSKGRGASGGCLR